MENTLPISKPINMKIPKFRDHSPFSLTFPYVKSVIIAENLKILENKISSGFYFFSPLR